MYPRSAGWLVLSLALGATGNAQAQATDSFALRWDWGGASGLQLRYRKAFSFSGSSFPLTTLERGELRLVRRRCLRDGSSNAGCEVEVHEVSHGMGIGKDSLAALDHLWSRPLVDSLFVRSMEDGGWNLGETGETSSGPGQVMVQLLNDLVPLSGLGRTFAVGEEWPIYRITGRMGRIPFVDTLDATAILDSVEIRGQSHRAWITVRGRTGTWVQGDWTSLSQLAFNATIIWDIEGGFPESVEINSSGSTQGSRLGVPLQSQETKGSIWVEIVPFAPAPEQVP